MTDKDFAYRKLTERPIKSKNYTFYFEPHEGISNLSRFSIRSEFENELGFKNEIGFEYLITDKWIVTVKRSSNKIFKIDGSKLDKDMNADVSFGNLEVNIDDFIYLISNEMWVVEDLKPEN